MTTFFLVLGYIIASALVVWGGDLAWRAWCAHKDRGVVVIQLERARHPQARAGEPHPEAPHHPPPGMAELCPRCTVWGGEDPR